MAPEAVGAARLSVVLPEPAALAAAGGLFGGDAGGDDFSGAGGGAVWARPGVRPAAQNKTRPAVRQIQKRCGDIMRLAALPQAGDAVHRADNLRDANAKIVFNNDDFPFGDQPPVHQQIHRLARHAV